MTCCLAKGRGLRHRWGMFSLRLFLLVCQGLLACGGLAAAEASRLPFLDKLTAALKLERLTEVDQLRLEGGAWMAGRFEAEAVMLGERVLKVEEMAAILGGQGTREARVFLRDGSVLRGRLMWKEARFASEGLGSIALKAQSPGEVVLRARESDGQMKLKTVAWMAEAVGGQVLPVMKLPEAPLRCRWLGGEMRLPWAELVSLRALPAPALEHELLFKDGTRVRGWVELPMGECAAWALDAAALMALLESKVAEPTKVVKTRVTLQDGSVLVGELTGATLPWWMKDGEVALKAADLAGLRRLREGGEDTAALFEITTMMGRKITGRPRDSALAWKRGSETLRLPWPLIQGIQKEVNQ